jgi:hypothetical protein
VAHPRRDALDDHIAVPWDEKRRRWLLAQRPQVVHHGDPVGGLHRVLVAGDRDGGDAVPVVQPA